MPKFVLEWDKELGWKQNPFQDEIFEPIDYFFAGCDKARENLNLFIINQKSIATVIGSPGSGKTMLLVWLETQLKATQKILTAYIRGTKLKSDEEFIKQILMPVSTSMTKFFGKFAKPPELKELDDIIKSKLERKRYVILIDDANKLSEPQAEALAEITKLHNVQLVVSYSSETKLPRSLGKEDLSIKMQKMSPSEIELLMKKRIEAMGGKGIWPFNMLIIKELTKEAQGNPRDFLKLCQARAIKLSIEVKNGKIKKELPKHKEEHVEKKEEPKEDKTAFLIDTDIHQPEKKKEKHVEEPEPEPDEEEDKKSVINLGFLKIVKDQPHERDVADEGDYDESDSKKEETEEVSIDIHEPEPKKEKHKKSNNKKESELKKNRYVID